MKAVQMENTMANHTRLLWTGFNFVGTEMLFPSYWKAFILHPSFHPHQQVLCHVTLGLMPMVSHLLQLDLGDPSCWKVRRVSSSSSLFPESYQDFWILILFVQLLDFKWSSDSSCMLLNMAIRSFMGLASVLLLSVQSISLFASVAAG